MRELSLKEIELVSGGMRQDVGKTSGGGGNNGLANSVAVNAIANMGGYGAGKLASGESPTMEGMAMSAAYGGALGYISGPLHGGRRAAGMIMLNFNGSFTVTAYEKFLQKSSQKAGTNYQNPTQAGTNYQ